MSDRVGWSGGEGWDWCFSGWVRLVQVGGVGVVGLVGGLAGSGS